MKNKDIGEDVKKVKKKISLKKKKNIDGEAPVKKVRRLKIGNDTEKGANFSLIEVIVIIIITGLIVSVCSGLIVYNNYDKFATSSVNKNDTELSEFVKSYNHIVNSYVKEVDKSKLLEAAIKGMYNYLNDAYSIYVDEDTTETLTERLEGKYEGVGIEISLNENNQIYITRVFSKTPAEEAGLKAGDLVLSLDGVSYEDKTPNDLATAIKGSEKSSFEIEYSRDGVKNKLTVERKLIYIDSVTSKEYESVGYVKLETFSTTTANQVKSKINDFGANVKSLIIDVRDNSGGYLNSAYDTANLLVGKGKTIYQLKDRSGNIEKKYATANPIKTFTKVIVLANESSASASEILTAALKENLNAIVVGKKTFGKGTVQETERLKSGAMVKYTTAYWLTPNGNSINEVGISPDRDISNDINTTDDEQLLKAIELAK